MAVVGIDHVNIVTTDLAGTVAFYAGLLGLTEGDIPGFGRSMSGCWLSDSAGQAVIHLQAHDPARHGLRHIPEDTGAIDHVAFVCSDFAGLLRYCAEAGLVHRVSEVPAMDLRQIFVTDPNNVVVELNFRDA